MSYPTSPKFSSVNIKGIDPTIFSQAVNGRMQSRKISAHRWEFTGVYPPLTRGEFAPVSGYIDSLRGRHTVFTVTPTELCNTTGTGTGTITCGATNAGLSVVAVTGLTGTLKTGDFIKFSGHSKVYKLTADRSGDGNIAIVPPLITALTTDTVVYNNVPFTVRLKNDIQSYRVGSDMLHMFEVDFMEAI